jgi:hypothetical protein
MTNGPVKPTTLEAIAREHGRPRSAVRIAVGRNLIRKAERKGKPGEQAKGCEWYYPPGTDRALRLLFRLQKNGYRGDALRFALWWEGAAPFSYAIPEYVVGALSAPRKDIQTRLAGKVKQDESAVYEDGTYDEDDSVETFADALRVQLDQALKPNIFRFLFGVLEELDPTTTHWTEQVSQTVRVFVATTMRIWPGDIDATALPFLAAYLVSDGLHNPKAREVADKLTTWVHYRGFFDELINYVRAAKPEGYEKARLLLRDDPTFSKIISITTSAMKQIAKAKSKRELKRAGPWQMPEPATKALALGFLVGVAKWIQVNAGAKSATAAEESRAMIRSGKEKP